MLREENRKRLDAIIQKMAQNGESDDAIQFVVNDFKNKYSEEEPRESFLERTANILDSFFGGGEVGKAIFTPIAQGKLGKRLQKAVTGLELTPEEEKLIEAPSARKIAGSALQAASLFTPVGRITGGVTTGLQALGVRKGASALAKIGTGVLTGELFDISSNLQQGKVGKDALTPGIGAVIGGSIPALGVLKNITVRFGEKQAPRIINSLIKPLAKDFSYGKNPGRAVAEEGIVANNFDDLVDKIRSTRQKIGQEIGELADNLSTQPVVNIQSALSPLNEAMKVAASQNNNSLLSRLNNVKRAITEVLEPVMDKDGGIGIRTVGSRSLDGLTFRQVRGILSEIGDMTQWTGNISDDKLVNKALKNIYGKIKDISLNYADGVSPQFAERFKSLTEKYADLHSAEIATRYRDKIVERQSLIGFSPTTVGIGSALVTAIATGGATIPTALAGVSGAVIDKLATTPGFKTRLAYMLSKKTTREVNFLFQKIPALKRFFSTEKGIFPGDIVLGEKGEVLERKISEFINKPKAGLSIESVRAAATPETALLQEARKYKSAEEFVNKAKFINKTIDTGITKENFSTAIKNFDFNVEQAGIGKPKYFSGSIQVFGGKDIPNIQLKTITAKVKQNIGESQEITIQRLKNKLWEQAGFGEKTDGLRRFLSGDSTISLPESASKKWAELVDFSKVSTKEINVFDEYGKSQLTDIWNKANLTKEGGEASLLAEARKYKSAEEFVEAQPQRYTDDIRVFRKEVAEETLDDIRGELPGFTPNNDGTITLYHKTTKDAARRIEQSGRFNEGSYFALSEHAAEALASTNKKGTPTIIEVRVDPASISYSSEEAFAEYGLQRVGNKWQISDDKLKEVFEIAPQTKSQLINIWNKANKIEALPVYKGEEKLTTKFLEYAKGKTTLSKQEILDFARRPELKKGEADLLNRLVSEVKEGKISAKEFADAMRRELLELKTNPRRISLKDSEFKRYNIDAQQDTKTGRNYEEVVFESPIVTNGSSHYPNSKKYFAHARGDEVTEGGKKIWREQEIQSDLLQKDNLPTVTKLSPKERDELIRLRREQGSGSEELITQSEVEQLNPFMNDRFGERIMRERIREKAQKGYSKYRLPTGETIGKIEGFTEEGWTVNNQFPASVEDLKVGKEIWQTSGDMGAISEDGWIITDILGEGRFKAVQKQYIDAVKKEAYQFEETIEGGGKVYWVTNNVIGGPPRPFASKVQASEFIKQSMERGYDAFKETFDLTGKSNPQYRRYTDWGKFLKNKYGGKEITDPQGNTWIEVDLRKEMGRLPIEAFGVAPFLMDEE